VNPESDIPYWMGSSVLLQRQSALRHNEGERREP